MIEIDFLDRRFLPLRLRARRWSLLIACVLVGAALLGASVRHHALATMAISAEERRMAAEDARLRERLATASLDLGMARQGAADWLAFGADAESGDRVVDVLDRVVLSLPSDLWLDQVDFESTSARIDVAGHDVGALSTWIARLVELEGLSNLAFGERAAPAPALAGYRIEAQLGVR